MNPAIMMNSARSSMRDSAAAPTVFVVDDDVSVRESLEMLIRSAGWRSQTFASADAFLTNARPDAPGCLILDVSLPGLDGLGLQQRIADDRRSLPIIFITGHGDVPMSVRAMKAGALEFLLKPFSADTLVRAVAEGVERSRVARGREEERNELRRRYESLTAREQEVMALVVSGMLNKQVGAQLEISVITVKAHRGKVMRKMQAGSLAQLVKMADKLRDTTTDNANGIDA